MIYHVLESNAERQVHCNTAAIDIIAVFQLWILFEHSTLLISNKLLVHCEFEQEFLSFSAKYSNMTTEYYLLCSIPVCILYRHTKIDIIALKFSFLTNVQHKISKSDLFTFV